MAMRGDAGEEVLNRLTVRLGCESQQLTLWRRGLTWYPGGLMQHIWAEAVPPNPGEDGWRVHVRTWCLKRFSGTFAQVGALEAATARLAIGALVRKPGSPSRLGLGAALYMNVDREDWTSRAVAAAAVLQVHDALSLATSAALRGAGVAADRAASPTDTNGVQIAPLPSLDADSLPALAFEVPFVDLADALRAHEGTRAVATHGGVTASFDLSPDGTMREFLLLEIRSGYRPGRGQGLQTTMSLSLSAPAHLLHALALNEAELQPESPTDALGGWMPRDGTLVHEAFLPQASCTSELVRYLAEGAVRRAMWLRDAGRGIVPGDWPIEPRAKIIPFKRRF
jgi:hypothetical protein